MAAGPFAMGMGGWCSVLVVAFSFAGVCVASLAWLLQRIYGWGSRVLRACVRAHDRR